MCQSFEWKLASTFFNAAVCVGSDLSLIKLLHQLLSCWHYSVGSLFLSVYEGGVDSPAASQSSFVSTVEQILDNVNFEANARRFSHNKTFDLLYLEEEEVYISYKNCNTSSSFII